MRRVRGGRSEHEFSVGGDLDVAHSVARICDGYTANFGVVFRRNDDFQQS